MKAGHGLLARIDGVDTRGRPFIAGVVIGERAAPIVGYMRAWHGYEILAYARRRGWQVELVA